MGCSCKDKTQYEVVDSSGKRTFGPTQFKTTADAMAAKGNQRAAGHVVRPIPKEGA